ncbi:MAG: hypothetical protein EST26_05470 [Hydrogenophaga sp.]|nr:hypothetical protein [Hydrogenophaga sp.]MBD3893321.1 hypothetical protein [Hydrogenophaga sp.]
MRPHGALPCPAAALLPLLLALLVLLTACASAPAPDWQSNAKASAERAIAAWLRGDVRVEAAEFARARSEIARSARPDLLARLELLRCASRVAALEFEPCQGFEALLADAAAPEQAYARYLAGLARPGDAALLPPAQRRLLGAAGDAPTLAALAAIDDPLARLVGAGVLLRRGQATPELLDLAVQTASQQGWRRPLLAWLRVQQQHAQAGAATEEAARIGRRIELLLQR